MENIIGQYSEEEFFRMHDRASAKRINLTEGNAMLFYGKATRNFYIRHSDGSWTNIQCTTCYDFSF